MDCGFFKMDPRLGIPLPDPDCDWESLSLSERERILARWEAIRGTIPSRIQQLEQEIENRQNRIYEEDDWPTVCRLYQEISEIAAAIHDLNLWYRTQPDLL
jgi:hypothetical protein